MTGNRIADQRVGAYAGYRAAQLHGRTVQVRRELMRLFYLSLPVWLLLSGCGRDRAESKADEPAATEQTTGPAKKATEGAPATEAKPTEVRGIPRRVEVLVPRVVREDLVRQTVEFCTVAYEDVSRESLEERFAPYIEQARWTVTHNEEGTGRIGPVVGLKGGPPTVYISFPDGVSGKGSSWWQRARLPGSGDESVQTERAEKRAKTVFARLVPSDRRSAYRLSREHARGGWTWRLELPGRRGTAYTQVYVCRGNGAVTSCRHYIERPIARGDLVKTRKEMESKTSKALGGVNPEYLKLFVARRIGRYEVWWQYEVPPEPEGGPEYTNWDAYTGELVSSNAVDIDGKRLRGARWYYNPKYHLQSEEEIIKRLQEAALARARELEAAARAARLPREVPVKVPKIVREDLVDQAVQFCGSVFREASREQLAKKWGPYLDRESWEIIHNARSRYGLYGSIVVFGREPKVSLSFPSGHPRKGALW